jgi:hypothetical protein
MVRLDAIKESFQSSSLVSMFGGVRFDQLSQVPQLPEYGRKLRRLWQSYRLKIRLGVMQCQ